LGGALTACTETQEVVEEGPKRLGRAPDEYGERSLHEKALRLGSASKNPETGSTRAPLQDSQGIITPSSLHFERHHAGVPDIDPAEHRLMIHGMVEHPLVLTMDELKSLPSVSRIHFVECAGNSRSEWTDKKGPTAQHSHGMASCSEWTGVPLAVLLDEVGVKPEATWVVAEGADACKMVRSLPLDKCRDDVIVAYGQNGEAIRPEQGYPIRLLVPGFEGNINVKWVRRLMLSDQPAMARDETSKYTDLLADGKARQFTFPMESKSVITRPSGRQKLAGAGFHEITGLAWSGRGTIERVEVSTDNGTTWQDAELQEPRHRMAFTRFRLPWTWDGSETVILSRSTDETGYVQPTEEALLAARGPNSNYHCNCIKAWKIGVDGSVTNV
jgi:sulfane dehydrogenase subunit SoxC